MVTGQQISTFQLPDFARDAITEDVPIPYGVAELEKLAASKHALQLQHPHMQDVVLYMNSQADFGTSIHSMYWRLSPTRFHGILDTIRTNLVALMAEMRASGATEFPSPEVADQAVNVVVRGAKRSTITVNTNQMTGSGAAGGRQSIVHAPSPHDSKLPDWIRAPWAIALGLATVAAGIAGVGVWVGWNPFS
jgi:hypothetical protein